MKVGFIGTGNIGAPMAQQVLNAGYDLVVHDIRRESATPLLDGGATWASSPRRLAEQCDVICSCLPGPREMEQVVFGDDGLFEGAGPGTVYVDMTTNSPSVVREAHTRLAKKSVAMLDAPVSGGMEGARTRDVTILVGGDEVTLTRVRPVLDAIGKTVIHVGDIGAGCIGKLTHNCAAFSVRQAMIECMTLGVKAGVEPAKVIEVFNRGAIGNNFDLRVRMAETIFKDDFEPRFALKLVDKDMRLAVELAAEHGVEMALAELTQREIEEAMSRGWGDLDGSIYMTLQEERTGAKVRF